MKNLLILCFSLFLLGGLASCDKATCEPGTPNNNCICPAVYDPVCGCDNVTYGNSCEAGCANVPSYTNGECK